MNKFMRYFGQGLAYLLFIAFIGYFSTEPGFTNMPPDSALIKFTFAHPGKRLDPCTKRTPEELAKLPPQKRYNMKCSRERAPLQVEFMVDGQMIYQAEIPAKGLKHDLPSPVYQRFTIPTGRHELLVRMRDNVQDKEFSYTTGKTIDFVPLQVLVVDFDHAEKEFTFR
jgi:hypothetical protein